jgi:hypothetical protein
MLAFLKKLLNRSKEGPTHDKATPFVTAKRAEGDLTGNGENFERLVAGVRDYAIFLLDQAWECGHLERRC